MTRLKIIKLKSRSTFKYYDKFANLHWGAHSHEGNPELDFFATPDYVVILFEKNKRVSLLFIFLRTIIINQKCYRMAGIGGVVTHKSHRHRGFATKLLRESISFLKANDLADFALLCTEIETLGNLYKQAGFMELNKQYYFSDKLGVEKKENGGMTCIINGALDTKDIFDKSLKLHIGSSNV